MCAQTHNTDIHTHARMHTRTHTLYNICKDYCVQYGILFMQREKKEKDDLKKQLQELQNENNILNQQIKVRIYFFRYAPGYMACHTAVGPLCK